MLAAVTPASANDDSAGLDRKVEDEIPPPVLTTAEIDELETEGLSLVESVRSSRNAEITSETVRSQDGEFLVNYRVSDSKGEAAFEVWSVGDGVVEIAVFDPSNDYAMTVYAVEQSDGRFQSGEVLVDALLPAAGASLQSSEKDDPRGGQSRGAVFIDSCLFYVYQPTISNYGGALRARGVAQLNWCTTTVTSVIDIYLYSFSPAWGFYVLTASGSRTRTGTFNNKTIYTPCYGADLTGWRTTATAVVNFPNGTTDSATLNAYSSLNCW